jgi:glutamate synthase domain-containing protein 1
MCGIAGILYKHAQDGLETGKALIDMLDGCQHRGPDSTGFALYGAEHADQLRLRFFVGEGEAAEEAIRGIKAALAAHQARIVEDQEIGNNYRARVAFRGDLQKFSYAMEHAAPGAKVISIGESLEIVKDVGSAHRVDERYDVHEATGTHGLGHVRLATESEVKPEASHPFWATGFADVAIVHNGQITNYWKMRRRLERRGFEFTTDNDSELIAVYLADKLSQGVPLKETLKMSIDDLDGTFSFLVSTKDEIGYAKDRLAAKPMIMYETDELIAIASEEVSLNRLFPGQALDTREPPPGSYDTWSRST